MAEVSQTIEIMVFDTSGQFSANEVLSKAISLTSVTTCKPVGSPYSKMERNVQIIQKLDYIQLEIINCKIVTSTEVFFCDRGVFTTFIYPAQDMDLNRAIKLSHEKCTKLAETGKANIELYDTSVNIDHATSSSRTKQFTL